MESIIIESFEVIYTSIIIPLIHIVLFFHSLPFIEQVLILFLVSHGCGITEKLIEDLKGKSVN
ncbi:hypothetical protein CNR26_20125 [Vibrio parahaemolyticus]|nr:hypothetical protein CNR26_20125 [Vibrio parahaemolyticus]